MEQKKEKKENEVLVGKKPFIKYIQSIEHLFIRKGLSTIVIKARGRNVSLAVDLAEASKNKFFKDLNLSIEDIKTKTEENKKIIDGKETDEIFSVSCIEITLSKKKE